MADIKILLIEDDKIEALDIKHILESLDYEVSIIKSHEEVIDEFFNIIPNLILLDTVQNGDNTANKLASTIKKLNIPIIYLNAPFEESKTQNIKNKKPHGYVNNPHDPIELKCAIELTIYKNQVENELKESEGRFRSLVENVEDVFVRYDLNLRYQYVSPNIEEFTGIKSEDFIGKTHLEAGFPQDKAKFFDKNLLNAIHTKKSFDVNFSIPGPNGLIYAEARVYPEFNHNGNVESIVTVTRDITEHKKVGDGIRSSEFKYRKLYESMMDAFASVDIEGNIIEFNEIFRQMLGYDSDKLLKMTYKDITPTKWHDYEAEILKNQVFIRGFSDIYEKEYRRKDGTIFPVELRTYLIQDEKGQLTGQWAIIRDISKRKKAEELLLDSENKFREVFENANDMITLNEFNENILPGKFIEVNQVGIERLGYSRDEFLNMTPKDIVAPDNHSEMIINATKFQKYGDAQFEITHLTKEGKRIDVEVNNHLFKMKGKTVALAISRDISERKKVEENLIQSEKRYRTLYSSMNEGVAIHRVIYDKYDTPVDYEIVDVNKSYEEILRIKREDVLGKKASEVYGVGKAPYLEIYFEMAKTGKSNHFETYFEPMDKHFSISVFSPGKGTFVTIFEDISGRKKIEDALRESEEIYRTLFESEPNYTILISLDGIILDINTAALNIIGISKDEIVGKNFEQVTIFPKEEMEINREMFSKLLKQESISEHYESKIFDKNGNIRRLETVLTTIFKGDKPSHFLVISIDITERKLSEDKIKFSLKEKDILLKEIHHRVKNNMQIISSLLNLQTNYIDDEIALDVLRESQNRVKTMGMIHEKLYQSNDFINIKFDDYILRLVTDLFYSYNIQEDHIKPVIEVDDVRLNIETGVPCGLIISELVSNSLKYAFPKGKTGKLKVSLKKCSKKYELKVIDNGIGFPEDLDFKNTDSLGLQLVNNLVDQIDGEITLDTIKGTKFKIIFKELVYKKRF
ncbi:PAS domain S-box protein [Methanobacterium sp. SMA-27]|uniref:PAS domain S-box protein n=1 Tax=Methanobacterium sp. SMA-27 TaxID=1495336 RepID=UPI0006944550|nr:PAS domain S-box protein [Methanobacterium sp. SMA-27]